MSRVCLYRTLHCCCRTCRAWAQDVTTPTTQTSTASGLTSQMWNLETTFSRFVTNITWHLASYTSILKTVPLDLSLICCIWHLFLLLLLILIFPLMVSTDQCQSILPGPRVRLQQQHCALRCSVHWQLRLFVRLSHVTVSVASQITNISLTSAVFCFNSLVFF